MTYRIGKFKFDSDSLMLTGPGTPQKLEPLMGRLLVYLIDNKNKTISKEDLLGELWDGEKRGERSLYTHMSDLRRILSPDTSLVLDNAYGKGYGLKEHSK